METISVAYEDIIVAGDFNSNILMESNFTDNMLAIGLFPVNIANPTHFTSTSSTLLDLFLICDRSKVKFYDQISAPCFSRHDLIFLTYHFMLQPDQYSFTYRDFNNINIYEIYEEFSHICWDNIFIMPSVNEQVLFLENNIQNLFNTSVPIKVRKSSGIHKPWFTKAVELSIHKRDSAYSRWKRFRTPELLQYFRAARSAANNVIKQEKKEYYSRRFGSALDSKKTWKTVREIGVGKLKEDISSHHIDVNHLNQIFTNLPCQPADLNFYRSCRSINDNTSDLFGFSCVNHSEVYSAFKHVKSSSVGCDGMHQKFVSIILPWILPYITYFFNTIITTSIFPTRWKHAKIIPIVKSKTEYRPIAILCFLSKVLERILYLQISSFLHHNKLLYDKQSGFRKNHSCTTALVDVTENVRQNLDNGQITFLILLDHSKAFDTVDHNILIWKLRNFFHFSSTSAKLLTSYLHGRSQSVSVQEKYSNSLCLYRGVPQGSILGPLLFSMYINDLPKQISHSKLHIYADDVQLYLSSPIHTINENIEKLNQDLNKIHLWATANGLSLNPTKSKCLLIHKKRVVPVINDDIVINNVKIDFVLSAKNLGIVLNNNLTWTNHINSLVGQMYSKLRSLWLSQFYTPLKIRIMLAKSFLVSGLTYGCELFANCDADSKRKLQVLFNNIIRYVYGLRRLDHTSSHSKLLLGVSFDNLMKIRVILLMHKIVHYQTPYHLFSNLRFARSLRGKKIIIPKHNYLVSEWQFYINGIRLWNTLPPTQQTNSNVNTFKKFLFSHFA